MIPKSITDFRKRSCSDNPDARERMRRRRPKLTALVFASALTFAPVMPAAAQGDTLAGKSVQMIIGFGPGGGYDLWGRTVGRHIGRHLPGTPTVIPQDRKSTRLNSSHLGISYAVFCLKKK